MAYINLDSLIAIIDWLLKPTWLHLFEISYDNCFLNHPLPHFLSYSNQPYWHTRTILFWLKLYRFHHWDNTHKHILYLFVDKKKFNHKCVFILCFIKKIHENIFSWNFKKTIWHFLIFIFLNLIPTHE